MPLWCNDRVWCAHCPLASFQPHCHGGNLTITLVAEAIGFPARGQRYASCGWVCACARRAHDTEGEETKGSEMSGIGKIDSDDESS